MSEYFRRDDMNLEVMEISMELLQLEQIDGNQSLRSIVELFFDSFLLKLADLDTFAQGGFTVPRRKYSGWFCLLF